MRKAQTVPVLVCLLLLVGCDKKASVGTMGLMDSAASQSAVIASYYSSQNRYVFTGSVADVADLSAASEDVKGTLDQLALGFKKGDEALRAKKRLSEEAAKQVENTVGTLSATIKVLKRLQTFMNPKTPEDAEAMNLWKVQILKDLDTLTATVAKLDASIKVDMAAAEKK